MSAAVYAEPYKLPAGVLALAVHGAFFALLYFGVSWQTQQPQGMVVDIWDSLPELKSEPVKVAPPEAELVEPPKPPEPPKLDEPPKLIEAPKLSEPVPPVVPPKADIDLAIKKKPQPKPVEPRKPVEKKISETELAQQAELERVRAEQEQVRIEQELARAEQERVRAEQERARAEQAAAIGKVVDEHKARIIAKIRRNIAMPPDVPDNARAEYDVTLLPGGSVLSAKLSKPSGSAAYDNAVERAILKAQPLPLPADVALFNKFRELHLKFSPKE